MPTFEDHPRVFSQEKVQPLGFYFWHLRLDLFKSLFKCLWNWTYLCVLFCMDKCIFSKKTRVLHLGRALTQNSWICPIMSYLWMIGLVMRIFFPVGPTFEDHPQIFSQNKVQPLGFYFWHLRLGLFKSLFRCWWSWTYLCVLFFGTNIFSAKNTCFAIWVRVDTTFFEFVPDVWLLQIQHYNYYREQTMSCPRAAECQN